MNRFLRLAGCAITWVVVLTLAGVVAYLSVTTEHAPAATPDRTQESSALPVGDGDGFLGSGIKITDRP